MEESFQEEEIEDNYLNESDYIEDELESYRSSKKPANVVQQTKSVEPEKIK